MRKVALVYDVDYTLINGYHPSLILEDTGINIIDFWMKISETQRKEREDKANVDIIYLAHLMHEVRYGKLKGLTLDKIKEKGKKLDKMFYPGLPKFFERINKLNPNVSHNIISVGIKPLLEGSVLGDYCDHIFGYTFFDDLTEGEGIDEIKSTSSTSEKIPSIVAISYGNSENGFEYPIKDMVYIGDGETDIPAFKFVKKRGGLTICVYDPKDEKSVKKTEILRKEVDFVFPADYREGSELFNKIKEFILE